MPARFTSSARACPRWSSVCPVRYIHTHAAIMHRDDFDNAAKLLVAVVKRLDAETVQQLKS